MFLTIKNKVKMTMILKHIGGMPGQVGNGLPAIAKRLTNHEANVCQSNTTTSSRRS
jgi:hypothetical protein